MYLGLAAPTTLLCSGLARAADPGPLKAAAGEGRAARYASLTQRQSVAPMHAASEMKRLRIEVTPVPGLQNDLLVTFKPHRRGTLARPGSLNSWDEGNVKALVPRASVMDTTLGVRMALDYGTFT